MLRQHRSLLGVAIFGLFFLSLWALPACTQPSLEEVSLESAPSDAGKEPVQESKPEPRELVSDSTEPTPEPLLEPKPEPNPEPVVEPTPEPRPEPRPEPQPDAGEVLPEPDTVAEVTPDASACRKGGEVVKKGEVCCAGLKPGSFYADSQCMPPAITQVCMACGDGKCDWKQGEDRCSCPSDCRQSAPSGACTPKQTHTFTCPDGTQAPWCECTGKAPCLPACKFVGTRSEGWYDSCDGKRLKYDFCSKCKGKPICDKIGSKSEGWYCDGQLIAWAQCSKPQGRWSCVKSPENGCSRCKTDSDCKLKGCTQLGSSCVEWRETCGQFQLCQVTKKLKANSTCDTTSGVCQ